MFMGFYFKPSVLSLDALMGILCIPFLCQPQAMGAVENNLIDSLPPGHWLEVPDSKMSRVYYDGPLASSIRGGKGPSAVMDQWGGAVLDTRRNRLVVWGGGHSAYAGNELYAFDLNKLTWSRLNDPSSIQGYTNHSCRGSGVYPDGNPVSRHTYGGMAYIPEPVDRLFAVGGGLWPCGYTDAIAWYYDFDADAWQRRADAPWAANGDILVYDPVTGHVFNEAGGSHGFLSEYDPRSDTWTARGDQFSRSISGRMSGAIDPVDHLLIAVGNNGRDTGNEAAVWNLSSKAPHLSFDYRPTAGPQIVMDSSSPGFVWDPDVNLFVAWVGGGNIFTLNPKTLIWGIQTPAADNKVIPTDPNPAGTFGRFEYVPSKQVFVLVNRTTDNVYIYRPSFGTHTTCSIPIITGRLSETKPVNEALSYQIKASNDPAIYFADNLPKGISLDANTGIISGYPETLGTFKASVGAANNCGSSDIKTVTFKITGNYHFHIGARDYPDLQTAVDHAPKDGLIRVDPGRYVNMYARIDKPLTIRGMGPGHPVFQSTKMIPNEKAVIVVNIKGDLTIDNIEITGAKVHAHNGAGIRYEKGNLTILNSYFEDNENGILGGGRDPNGIVTIRNSIFEHNGYGDGYTHGVYFGANGKVIIDHSTFRGTRVGHHIKSRAMKTYISNVLTDDGVAPRGASYAIDAPNGGILKISCTEMIKNKNAENHVMVTIGEEKKLHPENELSISDSLFLNNMPGKVVGVRNSVQDLKGVIRNSAFVRIPQLTAGDRITLAGNTTSDTDTSLPASCGSVGALLHPAVTKIRTGDL
jgi:hypothetical protein